ncbi:arachidonate 12-lipoxygenase, 12R type [Chelydra serpentina]|uniref:Arachidonate 12-lipoxygenase, 12R type n=1 Tax=Chelydra serpentina TaxID=8475 RepID=A0A8T1RWP5_CHESE|nr:arachidonate 12-lipoxygenase, 12R type [Chelydra serpentina]
MPSLQLGIWLCPLRRDWPGLSVFPPSVSLVPRELEIKLKGFSLCTGSWEKLEDIRKIFWCNKNPTSEYISEHWQEDSFFGYQFLNGVNPVLIRKCTSLPENFPVTEEMVAGSLGEGTTLRDELKVGRSCWPPESRLRGRVLRDPGTNPSSLLHVRDEPLSPPCRKGTSS